MHLHSESLGRKVCLPAEREYCIERGNRGFGGADNFAEHCFGRAQVAAQLSLDVAAATTSCDFTHLQQEGGTQVVARHLEDSRSAVKRIVVFMANSTVYVNHVSRIDFGRLACSAAKFDELFPIVKSHHFMAVLYLYPQLCHHAENTYASSHQGPQIERPEELLTELSQNPYLLFIFLNKSVFAARVTHRDRFPSVAEHDPGVVATVNQPSRIGRIFMSCPMNPQYCPYAGRSQVSSVTSVVHVEGQEGRSL